MFQAIKGLLGSKKFWLTILGSAIIGGLHYVNAPSSIELAVGGLFGLNIGAQGLADFGKEAKK